MARSLYFVGIIQNKLPATFKQTFKTRIKLLQEEQFDLGLNCVPFRCFKPNYHADEKICPDLVDPRTIIEAKLNFYEYYNLPIDLTKLMV